MNVKKLIKIPLILPLLLLTFSCKSDEEKSTNAIYNTENTIIEVSTGIFTEVNPNIELLSGVLSHTSWMKRRGPKGIGNKYYRDLKNFFEPYKKHEAIKIAEKLTRRGFTYDAPPNFVLRLGELPELENSYGYTDYLIKRAWNEEILEDFRLALRDLAIVSNFDTFYNSYSTKYNQYINRSMYGLNTESITNWMADFFGWSGNEFHLVFSPAMFPGGGYGSSLELENRLIINQIVRARGTSVNEPSFPGNDNLAGLTIHEFSHSFVNPSNDKYIKMFNNLDLNELFLPVEEEMKEMAYPDMIVFYNEMLVRAITIISMKEIYAIDDETVKGIIKNEKNRGFYFIEHTLKQLEIYQLNREKYHRLDDFIPELLNSYRADREIILNSEAG